MSSAQTALDTAFKPSRIRTWWNVWRMQEHHWNFARGAMCSRKRPNVASHPLKALMDAGVKTTLNTDDPGVMDLTLLDECRRATSEMGLSLEDLKQCNQWAAEASFIPKERLAAVWPSTS